MLARIGPVKPFFCKALIAHTEACGRAEYEPPTRSHCAGAATQVPHWRRARPREGGAHMRERGQRGERRRHAAGEAVLAKGPAPQRARSARASRPGDRTGGGAAYSATSRVSAGMLAKIGPVKPFWVKRLIAHSEACGRTEDGPPTRSLLRRRRRISGEPGRAKGAHRYVSAVSAEIAGGTLPEKRFFPRYLCRSVPFRRAESAARPHGRRRGVQVGKPAESCDAREDRAGEAVLAQVPDRAQRGMRRVGGEPGRAKGTHSRVSAVSAEIVDGTVPTRPG
jgi:hypothetical protein